MILFSILIWPCIIDLAKHLSDNNTSVCTDCLGAGQFPPRQLPPGQLPPN